MPTATEVRAHMGVGFGAYCRAHMGWLCEETAIVVATPQARVAAGGGAPFHRTITQQEAAALQELELERVAVQIAEFSQRSDLRAWVSSVLSVASQRGIDLSADTGVVRVLLKEVQRKDFLGKETAPLARTVYLAAALVASGFDTFLVGHGDDALYITRTLVAVFVDGHWRYAEPHRDFELGLRAPFKKEKFFSIPALETPERYELLEKLRVEVAAHKKKILEQQRQLAAQAERLALMQQRLEEVRIAVEQASRVAVQRAQVALSAPAEVAPPQGLTTTQKVVVLGLAGLLLVSLAHNYQLIQRLAAEKEED